MPDARKEYGDIIDLEHHVSQTRPHMSRINRAAQFAPFAALTGYDDLIRESARETESLVLLDENRIAEMNDILVFILKQEKTPEASFTYYVPDAKKAGGKYETITGTIIHYDEYERSITLNNGGVIFLSDLTRIECDDFNAIHDLW